MNTIKLLLTITTLALTFNTAVAQTTVAKPKVAAKTKSKKPSSQCPKALKTYQNAMKAAAKSKCSPATYDLLKKNWKSLEKYGCTTTASVVQSPFQVCGPETLPRITTLSGASYLWDQKITLTIIRELIKQLNDKGVVEFNKRKLDFIKKIRRRFKTLSEKDLTSIQRFFTSSVVFLKTQGAKTIYKTSDIRKVFVKKLTADFDCKIYPKSVKSEAGLNKAVKKIKKEDVNNLFWDGYYDQLSKAELGLRATCGKKAKLFITEVGQFLELVPAKDKARAVQYYAELMKKTGKGKKAKLKNHDANRVLLALAAIDSLPGGYSLLFKKASVGKELSWSEVKEGGKVIFMTADGPRLATRKGKQVIYAGAKKPQTPPKVVRIYQMPDGWGVGDLKKLRKKWKEDFKKSDEWNRQQREWMKKGKESARFYVGKRLLNWGGPLLRIGAQGGYGRGILQDNWFGLTVESADEVAPLNLNLSLEVAIWKMDRLIALVSETGIHVGWEIRLGQTADADLKSPAGGFLFEAYTRIGVNIANEIVTIGGEFGGRFTPSLGWFAGPYLRINIPNVPISFQGGIRIYNLNAGRLSPRGLDNASIRRTQFYIGIDLHL